MDIKEAPTSTPPLRDPDAELVAFLDGRSVPCPRCAYDLRDIKTARCPECGEPLILKVGTPRLRFGLLVLAMAPGCFSGVAAVFVMIPVIMNLRYRSLANDVMVLMAGDAFGFLSAASVGLMYRHRHRILSWTARRQGAFATIVWSIHVLMLALCIVALWYFQ